MVDVYSALWLVDLKFLLKQLEESEAKVKAAIEEYNNADRDAKSKYMQKVIEAKDNYKRRKELYIEDSKVLIKKFIEHKDE